MTKLIAGSTIHGGGGVLVKICQALRYSPNSCGMRSLLIVAILANFIGMDCNGHARSGDLCEGIGLQRFAWRRITAPSRTIIEPQGCCRRAQADVFAK